MGERIAGVLGVKGKNSKDSAARGRPKAARPIKTKSTMQVLIYQELRRSLMAGAFMPGAKVTLRSVSAQMGTSVMPVREAINRLIAERALEVIGDRQVIVPVMSAEKFSEIVHWRVQLEGAAARAACRYVTPEIIADLEAVNAQMLVAVERDQREALLRLNHEFHFRIYHAARSTILLPMIESLWLQAGPFTYFSIPSPKTLWNAKHHKDILRALKSRDEDTAAEAISEDILSTAKFLMASGHFARPPVRNIADLALEEDAAEMHGIGEAPRSVTARALGSVMRLPAEYQPPRPKKARKHAKHRGSTLNVTT
jgi:DNA-binding GntR family transcriptional regulator